MSLAFHYWMGDVHHCSGLSSPKWPILCWVKLYYTIPYHSSSEITFCSLCTCLSYHAVEDRRLTIMHFAFNVSFHSDWNERLNYCITDWLCLLSVVILSLLSKARFFIRSCYRVVKGILVDYIEVRAHFYIMEYTYNTFMLLFVSENEIWYFNLCACLS